jgi:branched-chain amino acid transport system substrate-binding protein
VRSARLSLLLAVVAVLAALVAGCGGDGNGESSGGGGGDGAPSGEPIVIGGTLGLSGPFADPSAQMKVVYDYWQKKINNEGGLLGRPVEMKIYDDKSDPATAQSLYRRLISQDGADLLMAPYTTAIGGAVVPIARSQDMLIFNGGFAGVEFYDRFPGTVFGAYTYQENTWTRALFELIDSLPDDKQPQTIALLTEQNPFTLVARDGYEGEAGVLQYAEERGMEVVYSQEYSPDTSDFTTLVRRAKGANPDLFVHLALPEPSFEVARTAKQLNLNPDMYCACGSLVTTLPAWTELGGAGDGAFATAQAWPTQDYEGIEEITQLFKKQGVDIPPNYAYISYAALQTLEAAVTETESLETEALREWLVGRTVETAGGPLTFTESGQPEFNQILLQFQDGENQVVWPEETKTGEPIVGTAE